MRRSFSQFATMLSLAALACSCTSVVAQTSSNRQAEFIESSSPLPSGGVVSSFVTLNPPVAMQANRPIYSQAGLQQRDSSVLTQTQAMTGNPTQPIGAAPLPGHFGSTITNYPANNGYVAPNSNYRSQPVNAQQNYAQQPAFYQPQVAYAPSLGAPTNWNVALRPNCSSCATGNQQAATNPPALLPIYAQRPAGNQYATPSRRPYQPLIALQNMPPNAYPGQGIFGSPKLYVDGQPVRNLLRYLIVP